MAKSRSRTPPRRSRRYGSTASVGEAPVNRTRDLTAGSHRGIVDLSPQHAWPRFLRSSQSCGTTRRPLRSHMASRRDLRHDPAVYSGGPKERSVTTAALSEVSLRRKRGRRQQLDGTATGGGLRRGGSHQGPCKIKHDPRDVPRGGRSAGATYARFGRSGVGSRPATISRSLRRYQRDLTLMRLRVGVPVAATVVGGNPDGTGRLTEKARRGVAVKLISPPGCATVPASVNVCRGSRNLHGPTMGCRRRVPRISRRLFEREKTWVKPSPALSPP